MNSHTKRSAGRVRKSVVNSSVTRTLSAMLGHEPVGVCPVDMERVGLAGAGIDPAALVLSLLGGDRVKFSDLLSGDAAGDGVGDSLILMPEAAKRKAAADDDEDAVDDDDDESDDDDEEEEEDEDLDEEDEDEEDDDEEDDDEDEEDDEFDDPDEDDDYDDDDDEEDFDEDE